MVLASVKTTGRERYEENSRQIPRPAVNPCPSTWRAQRCRHHHESITGSADRVITFIDPDAAFLGVRFTTGAEGRAFYALHIAAELHESGRFTMPVAAEFPLEDIGAAHRISETGHVRGKLILTIPEREAGNP